jgi:hypothetical protein
MYNAALVTPTKVILGCPDGQGKNFQGTVPEFNDRSDTRLPLRKTNRLKYINKR